LEHTDLLVNLVLALGAGLVGALFAARLGQSVILGYILAGVAIGPYTPGFVAAELTVTALADIGIILLMFAIGVELSLAELLRSGKVAILGTIVQMLAIIGIGCGVGLLLGWRPLESLFFGAVISISSSTVLVKIIGDTGEIDSPHGRLTLAWSTVQDLATVILIVVLSAMATDSENLARDVAWEVAKAGLFLLLLIPLGLRVLPWIFDWIAELRSREVFVLSVGVAALGLAYGATFFGLSLALGAFVAGIVVGESDLSHQILGDIMPLRDIFAGLFFVSVGMLVDPGFVARHLPLLALTVALIMVVKGSISALIALVMKTPARTAILTGALLAVSAEFSFLLARVGHDLHAESDTVFNLMLAGSAVSIMLAPFLYRASQPLAETVAARMPVGADYGVLAKPEHEPDQALRGHAIILGFGRVGRIIGDVLRKHDFRYVVIEEDPRLAKRALSEGIPVVRGSAAIPAVLEQANPGRARVLVIAIPDPMATRIVVDYVREHYPRLDLVVRTHSDEERRYLLQHGVRTVILGEWELALELTRHTLQRFGVESLVTGQIINRMRTQVEPEPPAELFEESTRDRTSLDAAIRRELENRRRPDRPAEPEPAPIEAAFPRPARRPRIKDVRG
jgi:CPA2 family monovalent cation:H+ antiporter-2